MTHPAPYARETDVALEAAQRGGQVALHHFERGFREEEKADLSPVTVADRETERALSGFLHSVFPDDGVLGEEGAAIPSRSGRRWIIDPIDGTRDFVRRTPYWAVHVALEDRGRIVVGVIHLPALGETTHAAAGAGCFHDGVRARASEITRLDKAVLMVSGFKYAWSRFPPDAVRLLTERCWTVRAFSGCYDVTMLARGKADIWLSGSGMEWDYAPARVIADECGARFFTADGTGRIDRDNCVICAPGLEAELRRILRVGGESGPA